MKIKLLLLLVFTCTAVISFAQASGNIVYKRERNRFDNNRNNKENSLISEDRNNDSVLFINASVLINTKADHFLLVLGVKEVAKNIKDCQISLNSRIDLFKKSIPASYNIKPNDIFTDFITQTKVYNYTVKNTDGVKSATQEEAGIQTKKNIHIRFDNIAILDDLLIKAAEQNIYDIIKVDYIVDDQIKVHKQLLTEANKIVNEKKLIYQDQSSVNFKPIYYVMKDNFYAVLPSTQYETYEAFETATVDDGYNGKLIRKNKIMDKTSFYEGEDIAGMDKVINAGAPEVGVQFILHYSVKYLIKKN